MTSTGSPPFSAAVAARLTRAGSLAVACLSQRHVCVRMLVGELRLVVVQHRQLSLLARPLSAALQLCLLLVFLPLYDATLGFLLFVFVLELGFFLRSQLILEG